MLFFYLISCSMIILNSCHSHILSVRTSYFTEEDLASYYIGTPDPRLQQPLIGQRLILSWTLPKTTRFKNTYLHLKVRLKNHQEENVRVTVNHKHGFYIYSLSDKKFQESGGILTYKVEIRTDDHILESWYHPLWVELISFDNEKDLKNDVKMP